MKIEVENWKVSDLIDKENEINPKPQYQRTSVWSKQKKMLLIDSIIRGYDIPKFYLRESKGSTHLYEVTDGQQRMRAIWEYVNTDDFGLPDLELENNNLSGLKFSHLKKDYPNLANQILNFPLSISIIKDSTAEEIRTLFARLQMGERLNPAELRNAIASNFGTIVQTIISNCDFFDEDCKIKDGRFKHQDYMDHIFSLIYYKGERNVKALDMKQMYLDLSKILISDIQDIVSKVYSILGLMKRINSHKKGVFRNKWAFVDMFYLLYEKHGQYIDIKPKKLAESFLEFEKIRKSNNKNPEDLIEDKASLTYNKDMYDYIKSFNVGGAEKINIKIRHRVFVNYFFNNENFKGIAK